MQYVLLGFILGYFIKQNINTPGFGADLIKAYLIATLTATGIFLLFLVIDYFASREIPEEHHVYYVSATLHKTRKKKNGPRAWLTYNETTKVSKKNKLG